MQTKNKQIAKEYYGKDKLYVFNGLHNNPDGETFEERDRDRPVISNLYDTFVAVSSLCLCFYNKLLFNLVGYCSVVGCRAAWRMLMLFYTQ